MATTKVTRARGTKRDEPRAVVVDVRHSGASASMTVSPGTKKRPPEELDPRFHDVVNELMRDDDPDEGAIHHTPDGRRVSPTKGRN